jgi:glycosyltransferase involved in cell wall biosynthesis
MNKNLLIINFNKNINILFDFFLELSSQNNNLFFITDDRSLFKNLVNKKMWAKRINVPLKLNNLFSCILFAIILPLLLLLNLFFLLQIKVSKKINIIICTNWLEKILFTPIAKLLKLKIIWLEIPGTDYKELNIIILFLAKIFIRWADIITLNNYTKISLENFSQKRKSLQVLSPGIRLNLFQRQENIYSRIAEREHNNINRKYFTIGTALELHEKQRVENLFQAIHKCLSVIPHIQLIVIGEGKERKNLTWLAKKMELDNLVWFVGEQQYLKKWFDNFDLFVASCTNLTLYDTNIVLQAIASGLPIIIPNNIGLEDFIENNYNGLITETEDNEELTQKIISIYKSKLWRKKLGQSSKDKFNRSFTLDKMVNQFKEIINKL